MTDYLDLDTQDTTGNDYLGGGYLGLDEPPAPAQPGGDPFASQHGYGDGGYLGGDPEIVDPATLGYASSGPSASSSYTMPAAPQAAPELSVQAPYLENVQPGMVTMGGTRGDLSNLVLDVEVKVEVYFGDAALTVEEFLEMGPGSVVELDRSIEQPVQLRVRGKLIAEGQLVTINGHYGLRIVRMLEAGA